MSHNCSSSFSPDRRYRFDARGIDSRFCHSAVIGALISLNPGEVMLFTNDNDPLPVIAQLRDRFGDFVEVNYINREPGEIEIELSLA